MHFVTVRVFSCASVGFLAVREADGAADSADRETGAAVTGGDVLTEVVGRWLSFQSVNL